LKGLQNQPTARACDGQPFCVFVRGTCVAVACFTDFNLLEKHLIDEIGYKQINRRTGKIGIERRAAR